MPGVETEQNRLEVPQSKVKIGQPRQRKRAAKMMEGSNLSPGIGWTLPAS